MKGRLLKRGQTWSYVVDLPNYPDGRRRQKMKGGYRTKKEAELALANLVVDVSKGLPGAVSKDRVKDFLADWHASTSPSLHENTVALHERTIRNWIVPYIGGMKVAAVTPATLQGLYNALHERGLGERAIRCAATVMNQALGQAVDWGVIPRNPAASKLTIPKKAEKETLAWTAEEAGRFMGATRGDRLAPLWTLFLSTGLRRGEALGLQWKNVDLDKRVLWVREARVAGQVGRGLKSAPKTKASRRAVPLVDGAIDALIAQAATQSLERYDGGEAWANTGYVFTDELGQPLRPDSIGRQLKAAQKRAGVPVIPPKELRHTFASVALEEGVHPKLVQTAMGHTQITTTMGYTHTNTALQRGAMETIGNALFKSTPKRAVRRVTEELNA